MKLIRYAEPHVDSADTDATLASLKASYKSHWFGFGRDCVRFEKAFARFIGRSHACFVNSGSSANLVAVASLLATKKTKKGHYAATPACTFPTTLNPLLLYGLKPVFIDVELPSWSIRVEALKEAADLGCDTIMLPSLNGIPHDMTRILALVRQRSMNLIEDACDALGSRIDSSYVGAIGDMGTFSFYVAHQMTTGEGGMVVTDDDGLAEALRSLREWGRSPAVPEGETKGKRRLTYQKVTSHLPIDYEIRYTYVNIGFNLKPLELQGALGLSQLRKLPEAVRKRKRNFERLMKVLRDYRDQLILPEPVPKSDVSWFWFPIVVKDGATFKRREIVQFIERRQIETRPILAGNILRQPAYAGMKSEVIGDLKNTDLITKAGFVVGVHPGIEDEEVDYIGESFRAFFGNLRN